MLENIYRDHLIETLVRKRPGGVVEIRQDIRGRKATYVDADRPFRLALATSDVQTPGILRVSAATRMRTKDWSRFSADRAALGH